jgi:hypothetical protein
MESITTAILSSVQIFGIELINSNDFLSLVARFSFNSLVVLIAVRWIYYPITKRKDYLFTFLIISVVIFLLCFLLDNVKLQLGFALGLFAIFGIIRYRTDSIPIKEMTYLFLVIGISVINALANKKISIAEIVFTNFSILFITYLLERVFLLKHEATKTIVYEKIDLIKTERREELIKDIEERTGLKINRIQVGRIDFLRDTVRIKIFFYENESSAFEEDDYADRSNDDDD